ncbi:hypothetical protein BN2476_510003 [Paraburkholderia piptadeniae]|uniref:Uncharacterized protein n=1 Tax=Paraburkholderia piptadeniae TaxID=1701573 RepID=A0A1N7SGL4_9BURK|nr:hypothetical protein BN2476_510003 [Paraburkholderia piptadeniae]
MFSENPATSDVIRMTVQGASEMIDAPAGVPLILVHSVVFSRSCANGFSTPSLLYAARHAARGGNLNSETSMRRFCQQ